MENVSTLVRLDFITVGRNRAANLALPTVSLAAMGAVSGVNLDTVCTILPVLISVLQGPIPSATITADIVILVLPNV